MAAFGWQQGTLDEATVYFVLVELTTVMASIFLHSPVIGKLIEEPSWYSIPVFSELGNDAWVDLANLSKKNKVRPVIRKDGQCEVFSSLV